MVTKDTLDRAVFHYCGEIINQNKVQRKSFKRHERNNSKIHWDYPAVVVTCCYNHRHPIKRDYSRGVRRIHLVSALASKLEELGAIGDKCILNNCKYIIGRCAEPHAANGLMKSVNCNLDEIYFSVALRPRTREVVDYCENCRYVFSNLT